jgi:hypothetical protein
MTDQQAITVVSQSVMPAMEANQARERYQQLHAFIASQMKDGIDYGTIPGMEERKDPKTGEILAAKKVLLKPGAEKLSTFFALRPAFEDVTVVEDWTGKDHGEPFFYYREKAVLYRGNERVCDADGSCNSMEKKYRYRQGDRLCPVCGKAAIKRSKFPPRKDPDGEPGWYCYSKIGGCGAEFSAKDSEIIGQQSGLIPNPDIADLANTILKMAQKRALVAAILIGANASDYFTQDIEEDETKVEEKPKVVDAKGEPEKSSPNTAPVRPYDPETVKNGIANYADKHAKTGEKASEKFRGLICGMIELCFERDDADTKTKKRHSVLKYLTGQDSIKDVPDWYVHALSDWLKFTQDSGGIYIVDKFAVQEANKIVEKVLLDAGQLKL